MKLADIADRLAAVDHELARLEALRALAQKNADSNAVTRLTEEAGQVRKTRDDLRDQLKAFSAG
jgi:hypothetical protein